ncbi:MAG: AMP-binding protein [Synergistaceae bacterium]|nr:AMP-binding protein [Synergistaceae bacterium]
MISALEIMTGELTGFLPPIDEGEMLRWQLARVRETMRRAMAKNSAAAARFASVDIDALDSFEALARIPFTLPEELTAAPEDFLCEAGRNIARVTSIPTSGSSGAPKRIYFTEKDLRRTARLFELGMRPIIGGGRRCLIMMSDDTPGSIASLLKEGVEKSGVPAVIYGNISDVDDAARAINEGDSIVGIPSQMIHLCRKYPRLRPESLLLSADYVPAPVPEAIRETWRCRVYTHYGMTESCFGCAVQCAEESAQHIRHDSLLIEIIDPLSGRQLGFGEEGEIVVTVFANEAMPLFRYRTGDISSLAAGKCGCGSRLPRLGAVKGRLRNRINIGGRRFCIEQLDDLLYSNGELWRYEAELSDEDGEKKLLINVCGGDALDLTELRAGLAAILPPAVKTELRRSESLTQPFRKRRISAV